MTRYQYLRLSTAILGLSIFLMSPAWAGFYIGTSPGATQLPADADQPAIATAMPATEYKVTLPPGSLKNNLAQLVAEKGWGTIDWVPSYDYRIFKARTVNAASLLGLMDQILAPYPLKATFDPQTRVILIEGR